MSRNKKAFTLVEIVLAIGLITTISGIMMAQFGNYSRKQSAVMAKERLVQVFLEAKTNALAGKKDCYVCGGADRTCNNVNDKTLLGWKVIINPTPGPGSPADPPGITNGYRIEGECAGGGTTSRFMTHDEVFPANMTITAPGTTKTVRFKPLNGGVCLGVVGTCPGTSMTVRVTPLSGSHLEFTIDDSGGISP